MTRVGKMLRVDVPDGLSVNSESAPLFVYLKVSRITKDTINKRVWRLSSIIGDQMLEEVNQDYD